MSSAQSGAILVLDLGTSRLKASLFTAGGTELATANSGYPTHAPESGLAEQYPRDWWDACIRAVRELWTRGNHPDQVRIISVTGQMHGVVPVTADNTPLSPCLTLRDRRSAAYAARLRSELGEGRLYNITGARIDASSPPAKFLWYRYHTDYFDRIHTFLAPKDWLRQHLTGGAPVTDIVEAAGMVIYDVNSGDWSDEMAAAAEIRIDQLPLIQDCTRICGRLHAEAAHALGLSTDVQVVVGAADDVEFIGAGLLEPGDCLEHLGSTGSLLLTVDRPVDDSTGTMELYPHLIPGRWLIGGSTSSAGAALEWLRAALKTPDMLRLPPITDHVPPLFLPYLSGERSPVWDSDVRATFWGLELGHTQADLIRAAFEGVAFSLRHLLDALCLVGIVPGEIIAASTDDPAWSALRADTYGVPLCLLPGYDPTALGAALIGSCALGVYPDLLTAVRTAVRPGQRVEPRHDPRLSDRYTEYRMLSQWAIDYRKQTVKTVLNQTRQV